MKLNIRTAIPSDTPLILQFIHELAEYEKLKHEVTATTENIITNIFEKKFAEVLIAECDTMASVNPEPVAFAIFFHNYSTFLGKPGLYLEDLFVHPRYRGQGIGKKILAHLAQIAEERGCGRFEWWVLDWNKPAIQFYEKLGAKPMSDWTVYRITGEKIKELAKT